MRTIQNRKKESGRHYAFESEKVLREHRRGRNLPFFQKHLKASTDKEQLGHVLIHWVEDQCDYFTNTAGQDEKRRKRHGFWSGVFIFAGTILAPLVLAKLLSSGNWIQPWNALTNGKIVAEPWIIVSIALFPALAALIHGYSEKRALSEHVKQYERMAILFQNAKKALANEMKKQDFPEAQKLILELGKEALAENGDWLLLHRERPLEIPPQG